MMLNIISIIVVLLCLVVIFVIIARRFSVLASIDVDSIPEEKEANIKNKIIRDRVKRKLYVAKKVSHLVTKPVSKIFRAVFGRFGGFYKKAVEIREKQKRASVVGGASSSDDIDSSETGKAGVLVYEGREFIKDEKYEDAEKRFIDALSLDSRYIDAYDSLAELYTLKKEWGQARETLEYACKLQEEMLPEKKEDALASKKQQLAKHYHDLGEVYHELDLDNEALSVILRAVELDEKNPKLLDALVHAYVDVNNRLKAERSLDLLRVVNPENQKLDELQDKISKLSY